MMLPRGRVAGLRNAASPVCTGCMDVHCEMKCRLIDDRYRVFVCLRRRRIDERWVSEPDEVMQGEKRVRCEL